MNSRSVNVDKMPTVRDDGGIEAASDGVQDDVESRVNDDVNRRLSVQSSVSSSTAQRPATDSVDGGRRMSTLSSGSAAHLSRRRMSRVSMSSAADAMMAFRRMSRYGDIPPVVESTSGLSVGRTL